MCSNHIAKQVTPDCQEVRTTFRLGGLLAFQVDLVRIMITYYAVTDTPVLSIERSVHAVALLPVKELMSKIWKGVLIES
jgi:hypothetical protein